MSLPVILNFGFKIDEEKLWQITDIPVEEILLTDLDHNLDIPFLEHEGTDDWNLSPRMLLANFDQEKPHADTVERASLDFPIELYFHQGQWIILDGVHRFVKAHREGQKTIKVRRISDQIIKQVRRTEPKGDYWDKFI